MKIFKYKDHARSGFVLWRTPRNPKESCQRQIRLVRT